jgi:hypothetical protein
MKRLGFRLKMCTDSRKIKFIFAAFPGTSLIIGVNVVLCDNLRIASWIYQD